MARDEDLPFNRGETYYGLGTTPDLSFGPGGINLEGKEYLAEVNPQSSYSPQSDTSGRKVRVRITRNRSAIYLLPRRIARNSIGTASAGYPLGTGVDGYVYQTSDLPAGVIDEFLPPQGVAPGDLFYLVIEGPTQVITATSGTISIAAAAQIAAQTGTSATSSDSGFVTALNQTSTTVAQFQQKLGRAEGNLAATVVANSAIMAAVVKIPLA